MHWTTSSLLGPACTGLVAGAALLSGLAAAQEQPADPAGEARQERAANEDRDDRERALRRILILNDGQVVRAVARWADEGWEYKTSGAWRPLDARYVHSVTREKEVLRDMKARSKELGRSPSTSERVVLATWMAEVGLLSEAMAELNRVLAQDPHQAGARKLLMDRHWVRVPSLRVPPQELEEARDELITFGAKAPRVVRELALLELETLREDEALRAELSAQLRNNSLRRRSFAAHALSRLYPGEELRDLLMHAVLDPSAEVRRESSFALRASEEPGVIVPIVRALNSANPRLRSQAAEALGNVGFAAAVEPLMARLSSVAAQGVGGRRVPHANIFVGRQKAYVQDFDVEVAQFQAVADPQINVLIEGSVLDVGIQGVQAYGFAYESKVLRGSLGQLTGEDPGHTSKAWLRWWEANQDDWQAADLSRRERPETLEGSAPL